MQVPLFHNSKGKGESALRGTAPTASRQRAGSHACVPLRQEDSEEARRLRLTRDSIAGALFGLTFGFVGLFGLGLILAWKHKGLRRFLKP